jgi:hypothetical protein
MSDINPSRMIPLHVCDQAVAACEAEIQKLREENARLRKAGDAMAEAIDEHRHGKGGAWGIGFLVRENWKTAKWGKQP